MGISGPPLSWSISRQGVLQRCARMYYLRYYAGCGGARRSADPETRLIYALGKLVTLPLALGSALHEAARDLAVAAVERRPAPELSELRARIRKSLNALVLSSRRPQEFLARPAEHPMLQEILYGGGLVPEQVRATTERMDLCTEALLRWPGWAELRAAPPESVLLVDALQTHSLEGVTVYAAPDLVYVDEEGIGVVVDFKSGSVRSTEAELIAQVALYALLLRDMLGGSAPRRWRGRVVLLALDVEVERELDASDFEGAAERVRTGAAQMRALLVDDQTNEPLPRGAFPLSRRRGSCPACPYWMVCESEIRGSRMGAAQDMQCASPSAAAISRP